MARGAVERDQRTHAVADERRGLRAGGIEQRDDPVGHVLDARERRAVAAAVAGQIEREHAVAVVREVARLQDPDAVVLRAAVDENDHGGSAGSNGLPPV